MTIEERLVRQSEEDMIFIGGVIEQVYFGQFGEIFKAIVNGLISEGLTYHSINPSDRQPISADRILGRLEGYQRLVTELETSIEKKADLLRPIEEDENTEGQ